jgi:hypothetical protein
MAKRPPTIPDSELDVLKVLWDLGQATVREAMESLRSAGRQWSHPLDPRQAEEVRSVLDHMAGERPKKKDK